MTKEIGERAAQEWIALDDESRAVAERSAFHAFVLGFTVGWKAQENRPFHCTFCGVEMIGATDAETVMLAQDHTRACEVHPLAIENHELRGANAALRAVVVEAHAQGFDAAQQALAGAIDRVGDAMMAAVRGGGES